MDITKYFVRKDIGYETNDDFPGTDKLDERYEIVTYEFSRYGGYSVLVDLVGEENAKWALQHHNEIPERIKYVKVDVQILFTDLEEGFEPEDIENHPIIENFEKMTNDLKESLINGARFLQSQQDLEES